MGKVVYDSLPGLWFFLLFINFKVSFLHTRNGFIYHLHMAKWVPSVHHAMLRSKHLASLFSWGHYHLFTFLFHITHQLLLYQTLMVPFLSKICGPCPRHLTISGPVLLPGLGISFLRGRKEKRHHFPWPQATDFSNSLVPLVWLSSYHDGSVVWILRNKALVSKLPTSLTSAIE